MTLTERVGRSGREAVVGLSPLQDKTGITVETDMLCPFCMSGCDGLARARERSLSLQRCRAEWCLHFLLAGAFRVLPNVM